MKELSSVRTRNLLPKCSYRTNVRLARSLWGVLPIIARSRLKELSETYQVSIAAGDLQLFTGIWYITHSGLLRIACRRRCSGIKTTLVSDGSVPALNRWIFKATVYRTRGSTGFVGYGDADPSNVSPLVHGAEMRIAETRAVNRALRKAYGIGLCSVEELGWSPKRFRAFPGDSDEALQRQRQRPFQRPASSPGPTLPPDPPVQPRSKPR